MHLDPAQIEEIFGEAVQKPNAVARAAYLDRACGGDAALRQRVEALLSAHDAAGGFLQLPDGGQAGTTVGQPTISEAPGTTIGPYTLIEQIGEGGFGLVFVAEQQRPVRRKVALKVIKPGMDTREVIARFEAERQALAIMDHPNIARVFDGGATESGRPYFVMELVRGLAITDYCDQNRLTPRERLELFLTVCHAVQHAHQKGIIHRDIKPSNVMVTSHDGRPVVKVIDFGVAKAISGQLSEESVYTRLTQLIGTPVYMSPEQAEMTGLDIDTRSDIYSLGVLLYELLTGTTPFDRRRLAQAALDEVRRIIREEEPPTPSTRLSQSGDSLPSIAANRHLEPAQLSRLVRGDLDWIVMKSLEKDRARRYETANGLARDIQRYLSDEPVEASPPSATYKLRKFARKYKKMLITAAAIATILVVGTVVSTWQAVIATTAQRLADDRLVELEIALGETERAKKQTEKALAQSNEERKLSEGVRDYLIRAFRKPDPAQDGRELKVVDLLDQAVANLDSEFTGSARIKGELLHALGMTYVGLGLPEKAVPVLEKSRAVLRAALGPDHPQTLISMSDLAGTYLEAGREDEALTLSEETLKRTRAQFGAENPETLASLNNLAMAYNALGRRKDALPLHEQMLKINRAKPGSNHLAILASLNNLAYSYTIDGRLNDAITLCEEALTIARARLGPDHPQTLVCMSNLASFYAGAGRLGEAMPMLDEALEIKKVKLGLDHPSTITSMNGLAMAYRDAGQLAKALPLFEEILKLRRAKLGPDHPETFLSMSNLAVAYGEAERLTEAITLSEETLKLRRAKYGPDHPDTLVSMNSLASLYRKARRFAEALPLAEETLKLRTEKLGADHPGTLSTMNTLAEIYETTGDLNKAIPLFEQALKVTRSKFPPGYPELPFLVQNLARCYEKQQRHAQLEPLLRELVAFDKKRLGRESLEVAGLLARLGMCLLEQKKNAEAEPQLRECLRIREQKKPDDWITFNTTSMLGASLLGQKKFADAEPLLLAGYEGMKARLEKIPVPARVRLHQAAQRLVDLYDARSKPDEAAKWRKTLDTLKSDQRKPKPTQ